jgi:hypothetical protein
LKGKQRNVFRRNESDYKNLSAVYEKPKKRSHVSPIASGTMKVHRHTLETIVRQPDRSARKEIEACLAARENHDHQGEPYVEIELSPNSCHPEAAVEDQEEAN